MRISGKCYANPSDITDALLIGDGHHRVEVLELTWGGESVRSAMRDWQVIAEVRTGQKGMYHATIHFAPGYRLSEGDCLIAADELEQELDLVDQGRAVVLHDGDDGQIVHVVWCRTDSDTMEMRSAKFARRAHKNACPRIARALAYPHILARRWTKPAAYMHQPLAATDRDEEPADDCEGPEPRRPK